MSKDPGPRDAERPIQGVIAALVVLAIFVAIPLRTTGYLLQLGTDTLAAVTLAYGWNLIGGFAGYFSFGQVSFYGLGAYATALLVLHLHMPWYFAVLVSGLVGAGAALVLGRIMLRLRGILFALGMLGL
ncbi:MAG: ABC transporter permease subunit, partial [Acetobacteraceae bacterium]